MSLRNIVKKTSDGIDKVALVIMTLYMASVTSLVIVGVVFRFTGNALSWSEELARWLLIAMTFIGASCALKRVELIGITGLVEKFPPKTRRVIAIIGNMMIFFLLFYMTKYGWSVAMKSANQTGAVILIPMLVVKINIPIGSVFMAIHLFNQTLDHFYYLIRGEKRLEELPTQKETENNI